MKYRKRFYAEKIKTHIYRIKKLMRAGQKTLRQQLWLPVSLFQIFTSNIYNH